MWKLAGAWIHSHQSCGRRQFCDQPSPQLCGMNIFNTKARVLPANYRGRKYSPSISLG
jgi:hypothetical protein